ncbi:hypothetical protein NVP2275O_243 [Vibrio phage 2.275.O._10N.286.54.E11]|nr:hypothetical protein NVP2275O_243 [Vibrio phage 2.275.O._10N.286.54.E11]
MTEDNANDILVELVKTLEKDITNTNTITINRLFYFTQNWPSIKTIDVFHYCMYHSGIYYKEEQLIND